MNWPVASVVSDYLTTISEHIQKEILEIITGDDIMWTYWCLGVVCYNSTDKLDKAVLTEIERIANEPTAFEIENEEIRKIQDNINQTVLQLKSDSIQKQISEMDIKNNYFGYNTFFGSPQIFQPSVTEPIDPTYTIGPGDEIIVMLWGDTELRNSYIVSRDGYLFIKNVGQVFVNGLNLDEERVKYWLGVGASPSDTVANLIKKAGIEA